jgi:hypothetical protein
MKTARPDRLGIFMGTLVPCVLPITDIFWELSRNVVIGGPAASLYATKAAWLRDVQGPEKIA